MAKNIFSVEEIYRFASATHVAQKVNSQIPGSGEDWSYFMDEKEDCISKYNERLTQQEQTDFDAELIKNASTLKSYFDELDAKNLSMDDKQSIISDIEAQIKRSPLSAFII